MSEQPSFTDAITRGVYAFFGSWMAIGLHTIFFVVWLVGKFDINTLTMWVSLEAIYLGIFILMAENSEQRAREAREHREKQHELQLVNHDVRTNDKALVQIMTLRDEVQELKKIINILLEKK